MMFSLDELMMMAKYQEDLVLPYRVSNEADERQIRIFDMELRLPIVVWRNNVVDKAIEAFELGQSIVRFLMIRSTRRTARCSPSPH